MVIPREKKVGFIFGVKYGRGLVSCRSQNGWSAPSYMMIAGPSYGWQIGVKSTDAVLVFTRSDALEVVTGGNLTLSAAANLSVGSLGRDLQVGTDVILSPILAYSRSRGLFIGATLEGAVVQPDESADAEIYGRGLTPRSIVSSSGATAPAEVQSFVSALNEYAP
jgi:lipid-binding SYLF domain-containing protein